MGIIFNKKITFCKIFSGLAFSLVISLNLNSFAADVLYDSSELSSTLNMRILKENYTDIPDLINNTDNKDLFHLDNSYIRTEDVFFDGLSDINLLQYTPSVVASSKSDQDINSKSKHYSFKNNKVPHIYRIKLSQLLNNLNNLNDSSYTSLSANSNNPTNLFKEANGLIKKNQNEEAKKLLIKLEFILANKPSQLAQVASMFEQIKSYDDSNRVYEFLFSGSCRTEISYGYALSLIRQNKYLRAIVVLQKINKDSPEFMLAHYNLGVIYYLEQRYYKALESFNIAKKLNPISIDSYYNIALTLEALHNSNLALTYYNKCLELNPNDLQVIFAIKRITN